MRVGHWRKFTNDKEGSWSRNYEAASGQILKVSKGFYRSKENLYICFSLQPAIQKILKPGAQGHKVLFQFYRPSKKYSSGDPVPLL
jgi:hypothetical protein